MPSFIRAWKRPPTGNSRNGRAMERAAPPLSKPRSSWKLATTKNWMGWWLPGAVPSSSSSACARAAFPRKKPAAASPRSFPSTKSCATRPKKSTAPARLRKPAAKSKLSPPNFAARPKTCHPERIFGSAAVLLPLLGRGDFHSRTLRSAVHYQQMNCSRIFLILAPTLGKGLDYDRTTNLQRHPTSSRRSGDYPRRLLGRRTLGPAPASARSRRAAHKQHHQRPRRHES